MLSVVTLRGIICSVIMPSVIFLNHNSDGHFVKCRYAESHCAKCYCLGIIMPSVILLSIVMLCVVMLSGFISAAL